MDFGKDRKGTRAPDGVFDGVTDQPVTQREDQSQHQHAEDPARAPFPNQEIPRAAAGRKRALPLAMGITTSQTD
jgi:hypothetical protein